MSASNTPATTTSLSANLTFAPGLNGLYQALWHFAQGQRWQVAIAALLLTASQLTKLAIPYLAAQAINAIQTGGITHLTQAAWNMLLIFLASVASWALHGPGRIMERNVALHVRERLSDTLYAKLASLPLGWHEANHSGETIHRVSQSSSALFNFAQSQFIYLQNAINLIGPIVALFLLSHMTGMAALLGYGLIAVVIMYFDGIMLKLAIQENHAQRRYNAILVDLLGNVMTIIALRLQQASRILLASRLANTFIPIKRSIVYNESKWCAVDLMSSALWCVLIVLYAWLAQQSANTLDGSHAALGATIMLGNVFMVYQYTQQAGGVVTALASHYQAIATHIADFESIEPIAAADPLPTPTIIVAPQWQRITLADIEYAHAKSRHDAQSDQLALQVKQLCLSRGKKIALVGESGSGKSTLLRVLAGLYQACSGQWLIDEVIQPELKDLSSIATLIPQDAEIFEGTLHQNLTFGMSVEDSIVNRAIQIASMTSLMENLPQGLETAISERGLDFSGGQKQRIAIARGLIAAQGSSLLLLDEPTASLDPGTEAQVYENLFNAFPNTCIISSIHRLHLLSRFDIVVFMEKGRVKASGTVAEVASLEPRFKLLLEHAQQAK